MTPRHTLLAAAPVITAALVHCPAWAQPGSPASLASATPAGTAPVDASRAAAEAVIGHVKSVTGEAYVVQGDTVTRAEVGTPIRTGAVLRTGTDGSLGATLKDGTRISFGPGSEFRIDDFRYAPAEGQLGLTATLLRGTLDFVSGVITRLRPESTVIRTPTSTVGIRGTHFMVKVTE